MRRPVRSRVRTLVLTVAVLAVVMGAAVGLGRRSEHLKRLAGRHAREARHYADAGWGLARFKRNLDGTIDPKRRSSVPPPAPRPRRWGIGHGSA